MAVRGGGVESDQQTCGVFFFRLFIYFWLHGVFTVVWSLPSVVSRGCSSLCGLLIVRLPPLQSAGSRVRGLQ